MMSPLGYGLVNEREVYNECGAESRGYLPG